MLNFKIYFDMKKNLSLRRNTQNSKHFFKNFAEDNVDTFKFKKYIPNDFLA